MVVVIIVAVIVIGIGLVLLLKSYTKLTVVQGSFNLTLYQQAPLNATLSRASWLFGSYNDVGGSFTYRVTGSAAVAPGGLTTTDAAPSATVTVTGAAVGPGTVTVTGTTSSGTSASASIPVTVSGG